MALRIALASVNSVEMGWQSLMICAVMALAASEISRAPGPHGITHYADWASRFP